MAIIDIEYRARQDAIRADLRRIENAADASTAKLAANASTAERRLASVAAQSSNIAKLGSTMGGPIGGALQTIADGSELAAAGYGKLLIGMGAVVGAAAGIAIVGAALVSVVGSAVGTIRSIDEITERLGESDPTVLAWSGRIDSAGVALEQLDMESDRLAVTVAGALSPAIEDGALALAGMVRIGAEAVTAVSDLWSEVGDTSTWFGTLSGAVLDAGHSVAYQIPLIREQVAMFDAARTALGWLIESEREHIEVGETQLELYGRLSEEEAKRAQAAREALREEQTGLEALGILIDTDKEEEAAARKAEAATRALAAQRAEAARRARELASAASAASSASTKVEVDNTAELMAAASARQQATIDAQAQSATAAKQASDLVTAVTARQLTAEEQVMATRDASLAQYMALAEQAGFADTRIVQDRIAIEQAAADEIDGIRQEAADRDEERRKEEMRAKLAETAGYLNAITNVVGSIGDLYTTLSDQQIDNEVKGTAAKRAALRKQFAVQKAFAIAQATISTAAAAIGMLANPGGYPGIALAAIAAAAGIAQIAIIAAQKPQLHVGGIVGGRPDEVDARLTRGEGVLTAAGVAGVGGAEGLRALNRGQPAPTYPDPAPAVLVVDGKVVDHIMSGPARGRRGLLARIRSSLGIVGREQAWG